MFRFRFSKIRLNAAHNKNIGWSSQTYVMVDNRHQILRQLYVEFEHVSAVWYGVLHRGDSVFAYGSARPRGFLEGAASATVADLQTTPIMLPVARVRHRHVATDTTHRAHNKVLHLQLANNLQDSVNLRLGRLKSRVRKHFKKEHNASNSRQLF